MNLRGVPLALDLARISSPAALGAEAPKQPPDPVGGANGCEGPNGSPSTWFTWSLTTSQQANEPTAKHDPLHRNGARGSQTPPQGQRSRLMPDANIGLWTRPRRKKEKAWSRPTPSRKPYVKGRSVHMSASHLIHLGHLATFLAASHPSFALCSSDNCPPPPPPLAHGRRWMRDARCAQRSAAIPRGYGITAGWPVFCACLSGLSVCPSVRLSARAVTPCATV